jgi:hypothetical protein
MVAHARRGRKPPWTWRNCTMRSRGLPPESGPDALPPDAGSGPRDQEDLPLVPAPTTTTTRRPSRRTGPPVVVGIAAALLALALVPATVLAADPPAEIRVASDATWTVTDADASVGPALALPAAAQPVCLNASAPASCPAGATQYGWPGGGWGADLSAIPGAQWIWAPGIDGTTSPADVDAYFFTTTVAVPGTPASGTFWIAADDGAEVFVNGTSVGMSGGPGSLTALDIGSLLVTGSNELTVRGTNGAICGRDCTYQENPGGAVFGSTITYVPAAPEPTDDGGSGPGAGRTPVPTVPPTSTIGSLEGRPGEGATLILLVLAAVLATVALAIRPVGRPR